MTTDRDLKALLDSADVGWAMGPSGLTAQGLLASIAEVEAIIAERTGDPRRVSLLPLMVAAPDKFRPLIQSFASAISGPFRAMIYFLIQGGHVERVEYCYERKVASRLGVDVEFEGRLLPRFESPEIWDAAVLRHFGLMKSGDQPLIHGYYSLRIPSEGARELVREFLVHEPRPLGTGYDREYQTVCALDITRLRGGRVDVVEVFIGDRWLEIEESFTEVEGWWARAKLTQLPAGRAGGAHLCEVVVRESLAHGGQARRVETLSLVDVARIRDGAPGTVGVFVGGRWLEVEAERRALEEAWQIAKA